MGPPTILSKSQFSNTCRTPIPRRTRKFAILQISSRQGPHGPGLSHHRTCRSAYGGSCKVHKTLMLCKKAHESLLSQPFSRYRSIHMRRPGVPPWPSTIAGRGKRSCFFYPSFNQLSSSGTWLLPLPPQDAPQFPSYPLIQFLKSYFYLGQPEVVHPAAKERCQFTDDFR